MATKTMSIHQALSELKRYEDRISRAIMNNFVLSNRKGNSKIGSVSVEDAKNEISGNFQKVKALIEDKKRIKQAVVLSNANTKLTVGNVEYTVAEAIERKNSILLEKRFLSQLKAQYKNALNKIEQENNLLPAKLESYLKTILGDSDRKNVDLVKTSTDTFNATNEWELIDPSNVKEYIAKLEDEINDFETEVDYKLSENNSRTTITVDLAD